MSDEAWRKAINKELQFLEIIFRNHFATMPNSIVSFNALTAWLRKVNNDLKTEHIHIEIRANYSFDDINWLCSCHGLVIMVI